MSEISPDSFPEHPLLDIRELGDDIPDLRHEVPYLAPYLNKEEKVVKIEYVDKNLRHSYPSGLESVRRLTDNLSHPFLASLSFPENSGQDELRKFENVFGRDSQISAWLLREIYPELMPKTVVELAKLQGTEYDPQSGEEPGGIIHENQDPTTPLARKFQTYLGWEYPFYGTVDATPLFVANLCDIAATYPGFLLGTIFEDKEGNENNMADALNSSVAWLERRLDQNPEGFLEFYKPQFRGLDNQAWMDSFHAYVHADGSFANHGQGIASAEIQGYAYDALIKSAKLFRGFFGGHRRADELEARARKLRANFMREFWVEAEIGGFFALATDRSADGRLRPLAVRTANMGLLLNSEILDGWDSESLRRRRQTIKNLFTPDILAAAGLRTMSARESAYNPYSYHNGGVWPHINGLVAAGLERHGYYGLAWELHRRNLADVEATHSFPEVLQGGDEIKLSDKNVYAYNPRLDMVYLVERVPQEIQAWAVAAVLAAKYKYPPPTGMRSRVKSMPLAAEAPDKRAIEQEILQSLASGL